MFLTPFVPNGRMTYPSGERGPSELKFSYEK